MTAIKYQLLKIKVASAKENIKFSSDTDKKYKKLTGLFASLPTNDALFASTLELKVANEEIFPEDFEIKLLTCGENVSPNERFYKKLECEAQGSRIEGRYVDGGNARTYPYVAIIYLQLEEKR